MDHRHGPHPHPIRDLSGAEALVVANVAKHLADVGCLHGVLETETLWLSSSARSGR